VGASGRWRGLPGRWGRYNAEFPLPDPAPMERAEAVFRELSKALTFLFDDGAASRC
jgi:hypothetical protein